MPENVFQILNVMRFLLPLHIDKTNKHNKKFMIFLPTKHTNFQFHHVLWIECKSRL